MNLNEMLSIAIDNGRELASNIATQRFGGEQPEDRIITRRWAVVDAAKLAGVTRQRIHKAEKDGLLPPPDMKNDSRGASRRMGYTISQINQMRELFKTSPGRDPETDSPMVICANGHKGGSWKTTTSVYLAQWCSIQGYKTLLIDMDPQATASLYHGYVAEKNTFEEDTALPFLLGEKGDLSYCIKPTTWPSLDIIPSCLGMHRIESELVAKSDKGELEYEPHMMLRMGIESVYDAYDIIIVDGSPNIGIGTINMVCAADLILAPTPAELSDYMSTAQFFEALRDLMNGIDLEGFEPELKVLITKYSHITGSSTQWMADRIRDTWGSMVLNNMLSTTEEIGKAQVRMRTIYEQNSLEERSTPSAWNKANSIFNPVFEEIIRKVIEPKWKSKEQTL